MSIAAELWALAADGDERAVKRAYARALKQTRPDEDATAFQQLHDAYQHALARCRASADDDDPDSNWADAECSSAPGQAAPAVATVAAPMAAVPAAAHRVDLPVPAQPLPAEAADALLHAAASCPPEDFPAWLRTQAHSWSLDTRDDIAAEVLKALRDERAPMSQYNVDALYRAFGWDDIASGLDPRELQWRRERADQAWMLQPAQRRALTALLTGRIRGWLTPEETTARLALLQQPRTPLRNLLSALLPSRTEHVAALMAVLGCHPGVPLPMGIDAGQTTFWSAMTDEFSRVALQARLLRGVAVGGLLALCLCGAVWAGSDVVDWILADVDSRLRAPLAVLGTLLAPVIFLAARTAYRFVHAWQGAPEDAPVALPWLRILALPLLIGATFGLWWLTINRLQDPFWGIVGCWWLTWVATGLAQWRYHTRRGQLVPSGVFTLIGRVVGMATVFLGLMTAIGYWAADLFSHRDQLRWRRQRDR